MIALVPLALPLLMPVQDAGGDTEFFSMYIADADQLFRAPKDQALLAALRLIDDRVKELPAEIPDFPPMPPAAFDLITHLLSGEKSVHIGSLAEPPAGSPIPLYFQLAMKEGGAEQAQSMHTSVRDLFAGFGMDLPAPENGLTAVPVPAPIPIWFGPQGNDFVVAAGKTNAAPMDLSNTGLPAGVRPDFAMHVDYAQFMDFMLSMMATEDPSGAEQVGDLIDMMGVADMVIDMAAGGDADRSYTVLNMPGYGATMRASGLMPTRSLTSADVALIPRDATWAMVSSINMAGTIDMMLGAFESVLAEEGMGDPVEMIQGMTGFHLYEDIFDNLGATFGLYASDTTGGGGMMSIVMFMELSNTERLRETQERVTEMIDGLGQMEAEGYVRVRNWEHGGSQLASLTFPGIPIPFEPTIVTTDSHLFVALTPQGALAAIEQASGRGGSLLERSNFQAQLPGVIEGAYSVSYMDTPRMVRDGYGLTSLLCSAIVNGTRSKHDPSRDAGIILPSYHELAAGAKASVSLGRLVGDDFVQVSHSDPSMLVNVAGLAGMVGSSPLLLALPALFVAGSQATMVEGPTWEMEVEPIPEEPDHEHDR